MPVALKLKASAPTTAGAYVKVNDELPFVGVTVTEDVPGDPTLGVIVPPCEPSEIVIVWLPLNVPEDLVTVKLDDGLRSGPLLGPLTE
jgi:hypothetical protein